MSSFLYQLGRAVARRRLTVLAVWIIALALAGGGATFNTGTNDTFEIPGTQSQDALDYLGRVFPEISGTSVQLVIVMPSRSDVRALATTPTAQMMAEIKNVDQVASVINPFDPNPLGPPPPGTKPRIQSAISADGRAAIITVQLEVALADVNPATRTQLTEIGERAFRLRKEKYGF